MSKSNSYGLETRRRSALKRRQKDLTNLEKVGSAIHEELAKMQPAKRPKKNRKDNKKEADVQPVVAPEVLSAKLEELRIHNERYSKLAQEVKNIELKLIN